MTPQQLATFGARLGAALNAELHDRAHTLRVAEAMTEDGPGLRYHLVVDGLGDMTTQVPWVPTAEQVSQTQFFADLAHSTCRMLLSWGWYRRQGRTALKYTAVAPVSKNPWCEPSVQ
jgi:hypothetical protein